MELRSLYPEILPYKTGKLKVSDLHTLYYEECGNPKGAPILFLHGGPGVGLREYYRQFYDPDFYRIILFAQRGAVQSTPHAELEDNNTWMLVEDIERLRKHLGVDRWVVFGGSWGSTLGLVYALNHMENVLGLILRGIYLGRKRELDWMYTSGADRFFPNAWHRFIAPIAPERRGNLIEAYYELLTGGDRTLQDEAAQAWTAWEDSLVLIKDQPMPPSDPLLARCCARIECHFMLHNLFLPEDNYILNRTQSLAGVPCRIVQGQLDFCCPPNSAVELNQQYPGSELRLVKDGSHWSKLPAIASELVQATDDFRKLY